MMSERQEASPSAHDEWANRHSPVDEDMAFQRATWRAERVAWAAMAAIIAIALSGALGGGSIVGLAIERRAGELSARFSPVIRLDAPVRYTLTVAGAAPGGPVELRFDPSFREGVAIVDVRPPPEGAAADRAGLSQWHRAGGDGTLVLTVDARPTRAGWLSFVVAASGEPVVVDQLVLP